MPKPPIQLKRSGTATATPSALEHGELAINYNVADGKLFWKDSSNVIQSFTFQAYAFATLDNEVVRHVSDVLKTKEGEALVRFCLYQVGVK